MTGVKKQSQRILVCFVGLCLAVGIVLVGKLSADGFRRYASEQTQQLVYNIIRGVDATATEILTDERIYDLGRKYIREMGEVYSEFAYFPRGDLAVFLAVVKNLPKEITVEGFDHEGRDLVIYCSGGDADTMEGYTGLLKKSGRFTDVTATMDKDNPTKGTILCKGYLE